MQPGPAVQGAELVAEYVWLGNTFPAGVAYSHPTTGYQTINLGFGVEYLLGDLEPDGDFTPGMPYRVDFMANIMEYFGKEPTGPGTGVWEAAVPALRLGPGRPNPFPSTTTITYALAARGPVAVRIYDLTGRLVRTLVDGTVDPGEHEVVWDGTTDSAVRAGSGVYFVRMEAGSADRACADRKIILLR